MTIRIDGLRAVEVLDSRGRPTVRAFCDIDDVRAWATAPSGASTGAHEAWERRDGDPNRRAGLGCLHAVAAVNAEGCSSRSTRRARCHAPPMRSMQLVLPAGRSPSAHEVARLRTDGSAMQRSALPVTTSRSGRSGSPSGWRNTTGCSRTRPASAASLTDQAATSTLVRRAMTSCPSSPSASTSTTTVSPSSNVPSSTAMASRSASSRWMTRLSGRAP